MIGEELLRYNRHLRLPGFGEEAQEKLKQARVLVIGAGGLGAPVLLYLTAAGVGKIGIVDFDKVEVSNLQRQVIFTHEDIGKPKTEAAALFLGKQNPYIEIIQHQEKLESRNVEGLFSGYDIIIDGSDNFQTRYLVNDASVLLNKALIFGSIYQYEGQVSIFNANPENGESCNYRDLYPSPPGPDEMPSCNEAGVLGVLPGMIGTLMATEAIKLITGIGEPLINKLLIYDALNQHFTRLQIGKDEGNPLRKKGFKLIDYEDFCNFKPSKSPLSMKEITVQELKAKMEKGEDFQLIDVREPHEYEIANLGGSLIPLGNILAESEQINRNKPVVIHCKSGGRSAAAITELEKRFGFDNLYNLKGGILAYAREIDTSIPLY